MSRACPEYKNKHTIWHGDVPAHWDITRFKNLFILITDKSDTDFKKIGLENIEGGTGKFIDTESVFEGDGINFKPNDILFGKLRPYLAKVYLATFEGNAVGDFYVFRCGEKINIVFQKKLLVSL